MKSEGLELISMLEAEIEKVMIALEYSDNDKTLELYLLNLKELYKRVK